VRKIKINAMRVFTFENLFGDDVPEYFPSSTPSQCGQHKPGEAFIRTGTKCPEDLCNWAYGDMRREINHLLRGGDFSWIGRKGVAYSSCTDGLRNIVFKIERI
jgi:uncharacterized repeat protein (TIGR04076 family)